MITKRRECYEYISNDYRTRAVNGCSPFAMDDYRRYLEQVEQELREDIDNDTQYIRDHIVDLSNEEFWSISREIIDTQEMLKEVLEDKAEFF